MPIYVKLLQDSDEDEADDEPLGVIWSFFWQVAHSRDRRSSQVRAPKVNQDTGQVEFSIDPNTGLPTSANDLKGANEADEGLDILFTQIVNPKQLGLGCTYWWKDDWEGERVQLLAYTKPEERTEEMIGVYKANVRKLKYKAHQLGEKGFVDLRPINPRDAEMNDLVWEGEDRMTIGFAITWEGWKECQRFMSRHGHKWGGQRDILDVAPDEVVNNAPQWKKSEKRHAKIQVNTKGSGLRVSSGGKLKLS